MLFRLLPVLVFILMVLVFALIISAIPFWIMRYYGKQPRFGILYLLTLFTLPFVLFGLSEFAKDMEVRESDIIGTYVIDKDYFSGPEADWQYNKYSFTIDRQQNFTFTECNLDGSIRKRCRLPISYNYNYATSDHLRLPRGCDSCHHVLSTSPTLWRHWWSFTYVFTSPHYGNMYFRKLRWWERKPT